jgi:hypothetical protein
VVGMLYSILIKIKKLHECEALVTLSGFKPETFPTCGRDALFNPHQNKKSFTNVKL